MQADSNANHYKKAAVRFLELAACGQVDEAYLLVSQNFRHHNPYYASDASTLKAGMQDNAQRNPDKRFEVQRAIAEGPLVAVHSKIQLPSQSMTLSVVHIFRFEQDLIAELWDVGQAQPDQVVNELGMF